MSSMTPMWTKVILNTFSLGRYDSVRFERPTLSPLVLKGSKTGIMQLPSSNFLAEFANSLRYSGTGFNITFEFKSTNCHELITATAIGDSGTIAAPVSPNYAWQKKACEFWIRSPPGTKIQLEFTLIDMVSRCGVNSVYVNLAGDVSYPSSTTTRFCGSNIPVPMTSVANELNVLFFSKRDNKRFGATWTVVSDAS
ncbi:bone morphogenetic protein 1-like [Palaemon carinicauda]|uniref:bone morphogenetic protein 1-like n=1 Tax=Palaemon carinicauda TaxID=392227 RepID=UPI0035B609A7